MKFLAVSERFWYRHSEDCEKNVFLDTVTVFSCLHLDVEMKMAIKTIFHNLIVLMWGCLILHT